MSVTIQIKRGLAAGLPTLADGEPGWTTDTHALYVGQSGTNYNISSGFGGAPTNADYLVKTSNGTLTAERVVTDTATVVADWTAAGVVAFNVPDGSLGTVKLGGDITAAGKALLDDASAFDQRATLGLGSVATFSRTTDTTLSDSPGDIPSQSAVKAYVDNSLFGLAWKHSVRVATAIAGTLATAFENGDTVDGVTLVTGDRILIKNQVTASENGIYVVQASGPPVRGSDANVGSEMVGATVMVEEGTANADTQWTCSTNAPITLGTTAITFVQVSGAGTYSAGTGLTLTGNQFSLAAHATSHKAGGSDSIKLDELAAPTDITTLNASTTAHGLLKKLSGNATEYMDGTGSWSTPGGPNSQTVTGPTSGAATTGTILIPTSYKMVRIKGVAAGGGGGSGRVGASASIRTGGNGGNGGNFIDETFILANLGLTPVSGNYVLYYSLGAPGAGGAAVGTTAANGNQGVSATDTLVRKDSSGGTKIVQAFGGVAGSGGAAVNPNPANLANAIGVETGGIGGQSGTAGGVQNGITYRAPTGGQSGASLTSGNVLNAPSFKNVPQYSDNVISTTSGMGNGAPGGDGGATAGANGSNGFDPGGGGGGGAGQLTGSLSGAGGRGGIAELNFMWW